MFDNYEIYLVETDFKDEDKLFTSIAKIPQEDNDRKCFSLTTPCSDGQISVWESDSNITISEIFDISPPSDDPWVRALFEKMGEATSRYVSLLEFEGPNTVEGMKEFYFNGKIYFYGEIYIGIDETFPNRAWIEFKKEFVDSFDEKSKYREYIFESWGLLGFKQSIYEPGDQWVNEIVRVSKHSGLGRDFITWGRVRTIEEINAEKDLRP